MPLKKTVRKTVKRKSGRGVKKTVRKTKTTRSRYGGQGLFPSWAPYLRLS